MKDAYVEILLVQEKMKRVFKLKSFLSLLLIYAFLLLGFSSADIQAQPANSPWPMFHGSFRHGGMSPYDTSYIDGTVKWVFEAGDAIESSPAIGADGTIYFGSHDGHLYAVNPDGTLKWKFNAGPPVYDERWDVTKSIMATPAIAQDGTIYAYSSANYLFAINPAGVEIWRFYVKWANDFWSSPTIGPDGTIYVGSARSQDDPNFDGGLHAINPDGSEKWLFLNDCGVTSTAAIGPDGTIYFGGNDIDWSSGSGNVGKVYALNPDGTKKWEFTTDTWMESSPVIGPDGTIYTGSGREARVYAFSPDGIEKWRFQAEVGVSALPAIGEEGTLYVGAWDCNFYALNPDGSEKWRYKTPDAFEGIISSAAIGADGTIYVGSNSGNFYAFNPDGTVKWHYDNTGSGFVTSPAIGIDGTVYAGTVNGKFFAFGGSLKIEEDTDEDQELIMDSWEHYDEYKEGPEPQEEEKPNYYVAGAIVVVAMLTFISIAITRKWWSGLRFISRTLYSRKSQVIWGAWILLLGTSLFFIHTVQNVHSISQYLKAFFILDLPASWCPTFLTIYGITTLLINLAGGLGFAKAFKVVARLAGFVLLPVGLYATYSFTQGEPFGWNFMYIYAQTIHISEVLTGILTVLLLWVGVDLKT